MKEYLYQLINSVESIPARIALVREYLQARALESLQDAGIFSNWAFVGGTALRFLYSIPRFSEDLDFSVIRIGQDSAFRDALSEIKNGFVLDGFHAEVRFRDAQPVLTARIQFPGLLYDLKLHPHPARVFTIKLELDTNPPAGAEIATSVIRRHVTLNICHHDKASLLAGKLHAVLSRSWTKGRDIFDLVWYIADLEWPEPNITMLNNALSQTNWSGPFITKENWKTQIYQKIKDINWQSARNDVEPFLERQQDILLISVETLSKLLEQ